MRRILMLLVLALFLIVPVSAMDITAPTAPSDVQDLMPAETESFADGLWTVIKSAIGKFAPDLKAATGSCLALIAVVLLASILNGMPGSNASTVVDISEYGKVLLPVMTAALAAQGGMTGATALYAGTAIFTTVLSVIISKVLIPLVYAFLALAIAGSAIGEEMLKRLRDFIKWLLTWSLKTILYIFTGYMSITGVITGTADAAAAKAAKITISGVVPVVGGILSDASEAVVISAGVMKNAAGIYGLLAVAAIWITPFLQIGTMFLLLKFTAILCSVFGVKESSDLIEDFSGAMGVLLGMTGTVSLLILISTICFMKGMG